MRTEIQRRQTFTEAVIAFLKANPGCWIPAVEFEAVGGRQAWRSRIAEARQIIAREGGTVENRCARTKTGVLSEYRYLPAVPIGRSAETVIEPRLF